MDRRAAPHKLAREIGSRRLREDWGMMKGHAHKVLYYSLVQTCILFNYSPSFQCTTRKNEKRSSVVSTRLLPRGRRYMANELFVVVRNGHPIVHSSRQGLVVLICQCFRRFVRSHTTHVAKQKGGPGVSLIVVFLATACQKEDSKMK